VHNNTMAARRIPADHVRWLSGAYLAARRAMRAKRNRLPDGGGGKQRFVLDYTSLTFFSGRLRTGLPVAAKIAFITDGATTQMVGSPTPPQKS
jgi:hypothetical protein